MDQLSRVKDLYLKNYCLLCSASWWSEEVGDGLVADLCCLCFWVSCGFWSLTRENDVACERRVGVSKVEVRANSSHWKQQPC